MRVLVITRAPWRNDNNTGNTMTNFFSDMKDVEFYNLYFRNQLPQNDIVDKSFAISEGQLVKNLLKREPIGKEICEQDEPSMDADDKLYKNAKKFGITLLMYAREIVWSIGRWKNDALRGFLDDIKPDVIFMPVFNCYYPHKVLQFVKKHTDAKVVLFHADDNYTLKQFSISPLYWLYRFNLRRWVKKSVSISDVNYAISPIQKEEYEKMLNKKFKLLTKGLDFSSDPNFKNEYNKPLQLVFTGNINVNRWKSLRDIAKTLEKININGTKIQMLIYTATPLTTKMKKALNINGSSKIMGYVMSSEIPKIQKEADILVHVEAKDFKNRLKVRQSFSTKIVDYLATSRPILAYGPKTVASISYFYENNCAMVTDDVNELYEILSKVIEDNRLLDDYVRNAFISGRKHHNKYSLEQMLKEDFKSACR